MYVHFQRWQGKYGLGGRALAFDVERLPLLRFLVSHGDAALDGTTADLIRWSLCAPDRFPRYAALYCVLTEVSELRSGASAARAGALGDLRVLLRLGPADCDLAALLWDIDHGAALPKAFGGAGGLALAARLPLRARVAALERLLDARGIALPDARRFLTEFLMDGAAVPGEALAAHVRVRAALGDAYGAWRCIEYCGRERAPALLALLEQECARLPGGVALLARVPFHADAIAIIERGNAELGRELRAVRALPSC
jgi:hypothetical protein